MIDVDKRIIDYAERRKLPAREQAWRVCKATTSKTGSWAT